MRVGAVLRGVYTILTACFYHGPVGDGVSGSQYLEADDGNVYVAKASYIPRYPKTAVNELVATRLAVSLGLKVPDFALITVPAELIAGEPMLQAAGFTPGLHWASKYDQTAIRVTGEDAVRRAINKEDIPMIIAFDHWIRNFDRADHPGNLLLRGEPGHEVLSPIDHGHAFYGAAWSEAKLLELSGVVEPIIVGANRVYSLLVRYMSGAERFSVAIAAIEQLPDELIQQCLDVPEAWPLSETEKDALRRFLLERRKLVRQALSEFEDHHPFLGVAAV